MTAKKWFRDMMKERRKYHRDSMEYFWRSRAARKFFWIMRGIPASEWPHV